MGRTKIPFLVDSGSALTLINERVYDGLPENSRPKLQSANVILIAATGDRIGIRGKAMFGLKVGSIVYEHEVIVANTEGTTCFLGLDFLTQNYGELNFHDRVLRLGGNTLKLGREPGPNCASIRVAKGITIPPDSEFFLRGYVERKCDFKEGVVEPVSMVTRKGLMLARSIVDGNSTDCLLSVINTGYREVRISKGSLIAYVQEVESLPVVTPSSFRESELPTHLQPLLDNASDKLTVVERGV